MRSRSQPVVSNGHPDAGGSGWQTHFGDPCIHCGIGHDDVPSGVCKGDPAKAKVIGYASLGVRPDGVEHFRYRLSTNEVRETHQHVSFRAPYHHFGRSEDLINPPPYDGRLSIRAISGRRA